MLGHEAETSRSPRRCVWGFTVLFLKMNEKFTLSVPAVCSEASWVWPGGSQAAFEDRPEDTPFFSGEPELWGARTTSPHLCCFPLLNVSFLSASPCHSTHFKKWYCISASLIVGGWLTSFLCVSESFSVVLRTGNSVPEFETVYFRCPFWGQMTCSGARLSHGRGLETKRAGSGFRKLRG